MSHDVNRPQNDLGHELRTLRGEVAICLRIALRVCRVIIAKVRRG